MSNDFQNTGTDGRLPSKQCPDCRLLKPSTEFSRNAARPDGLQFYCKACYAKRSARTYRERQMRRGKPVRERVEVPSGQKFCPGCRTVTSLENWHKNATSHDGYAAYCKDCRRVQGRQQHLKRSLGLTPEAASALIDAQDGLCAICSSRPVKHIDHDHETQAVRGGLCGPCNMGLGQFQDQPDLLLAAARYLRTHGRPAKDWPEPVVVEVYPYRGPFILEYDFQHRAA